MFYKCGFEDIITYISLKIIMYIIFTSTYGTNFKIWRKTSQLYLRINIATYEILVNILQ